MPEAPTFLAVVQARSGSKGIPNKNIRLFCGKPLMAYSIEAAKGCKRIGRIIVSTDSERYARIARRYGAEVPFLRPKHLATDRVSDVELYVHLLDWLKQHEGYVPDYIIKLQPTSPLRTSEDINRCIDLALQRDRDGAMSFCSTEQLLYTIDGGDAKLLFKNAWVKYTNRQSLPAAYKLNGAAVWVIRTSTFLRTKSFLRGKLAAYVMEKWRSPDLDNEEDFRLAELIYRNRRRFR